MLGDKDYAQTMNHINDNAQILEAVKKDPSAVSYVGIGYVIGDDGKVLPGLRPLEVVLAAGGAGVSPRHEAVTWGRYPLSRPLLQYTNGAPKGDALHFLPYELSPAGQKLAEEQGFYPVGGDLATKNQKAMGR